MNDYIPILNNLEFNDKLPKDWELADTGFHLSIDEDILARESTSFPYFTHCANVMFMVIILKMVEKKLVAINDDATSKTISENIDQLVEASFAWHFDWRYFDHETEPYQSLRDGNFNQKIAYQFLLFFQKNLKEIDRIRHYGPLTELKTLYIWMKRLFARQPKNKKQCLDYIQAVCKNIYLAKVGVNGDIPYIYVTDFPSKKEFYDYMAPMIGKPVPPQVMDAHLDLTSIDIDQEAKKFLSSLNHRQNPFLRSPEEMKALGFEGEPYN